MQTPVRTFLPNSLESWLVVLGTMLTWLGSVIVFWTKMTDKVNGLGERVKTLETASAEKAGRMARYENELSDSRRQQANVHERLGRVEKAVEATNEHITEMKLEVMGHLSEIKTLITEKDAMIRERVAVIETRQRRDD